MVAKLRKELKWSIKRKKKVTQKGKRKKGKERGNEFFLDLEFCGGKHNESQKPQKIQIPCLHFVALLAMEEKFKRKFPFKIEQN